MQAKPTTVLRQCCEPLLPHRGLKQGPHGMPVAFGLSAWSSVRACRTYLLRGQRAGCSLILCWMGHRSVDAEALGCCLMETQLIQSQQERGIARWKCTYKAALLSRMLSRVCVLYTNLCSYFRAREKRFCLLLACQSSGTIMQQIYAGKYHFPRVTYNESCPMALDRNVVVDSGGKMWE